MIAQVIVTIFLVYLLSLVIHYGRQYRQWIQLTSKITPMGKLHPIWGHFVLFDNMKGYFRTILDTQEKTRTKLFHGWTMFFYPSFGVCHPDTAKVLLKSSEPKPRHSVGGSYRFLLPWLGDGLLLSDGRKWERNRRLLTPAFHFDILKPYVQIYNDVADIFLEKLQKACDSNQSIEIYKLVSLATLDTMLRCSLSYNERVQEMGDSHPYVEQVNRLTTLAIKRMITPWVYPDFMYGLTADGRENKKLTDSVHQFADEIIQSRIRALQLDPDHINKRRKDFLDILITAKDENGKGLSPEEIRAEVDTFLFEGHDTTASAISWAIYSLAKYPEIQEKVHQEVVEILGERQHLQWDDLSRLKYMSMFLREVMRMHSPVPAVSRYLTKPLCVEGLEIPPYFALDVVIHAANHHPDVWPDHMDFKPERFEDEAKLSRDPFSYFPFSAGPRNCIGQNFAFNEQKVMIGSLLNRFKVSLVDGHVYEEFPDVVMRSRYGIKINLEERK
ncbi:ultra-long-chain fatty acid omega-hydroxylase-like [Saccostrea cucullata]|uniref:ultra-long-chain fatty acid omega-hydroxylase-like n=1 Tax=Saccostrea cuccullata TaxID=36930 RepID=UPI002ED38327